MNLKKIIGIIIIAIAFATVLTTVSNAISFERVILKTGDIDLVPPEVVVSYSTTEPTKDAVTVIVTANEPIREVEGWTLSNDQKILTKTFSQNWEGSFTVKDLSGNKTIVNFTITNIDRVLPTTAVGYSRTTPTNKDVTVTINVNKKVKPVNGWTLSDDQKTLTKVFTENASETVKIEDLVGHETTENIEVSNIDKVKPIVSVKYSTTEPTDKPVTVTITANEQIKEVDTWTRSENKKQLSKVFTENEGNILQVMDLAGNYETVQVMVSNINGKVNPNIKGDINKDGKVTATDLLILKNVLVGSTQISDEDVELLDMNNDEKITGTDLLLLKRVIVGLINIS